MCYAILCGDENGRRWETNDEGSRDKVLLDSHQPIIFNPDSFEIGTKIEIKEPCGSQPS